MGEARPKVHQIFAKIFCEFLLGIFMALQQRVLWRFIFFDFGGLLYSEHEIAAYSEHEIAARSPEYGVARQIRSRVH